MATEAEIILRVRRRVSDFEPPRAYDDKYYKDAIQFALEKLSFDFDEDYTTVPLVPVRRTFLLTKLATIEMAYFRASRGAEGEEGEADKTRYTTIAVPDLSVSDSNEGKSRGPSYWLELANRLQSEYDEEVGSKAGQNQGGVIDEAVTFRTSLTHGGKAKRKLDPGLASVSVSTPTVNGSEVEIEWSKLVAYDFLLYELVRSSDATFADSDLEEIVNHFHDNDRTDYTETDVPVGTWYYMVRTVNPNRLKTDSNIVSATVV